MINPTSFIFTIQKSKIYNRGENISTNIITAKVNLKSDSQIECKVYNYIAKNSWISY